MKLSKHQKEIIKKIVAEEISDIPSYLKSSSKGHVAKYDTLKAKQLFNQHEHGVTYKVMKEGCSTIATKVTHTSGPFGISFDCPSFYPRPRNSISDDEWEYQPAQLNEIIIPYSESYEERTYKFDFQNEGVFVADNFECIIDFMTLWSFLKREGLVLEVSKPIEAIDIGVYYQLIPVTPNGEGDKTSWTFEETGIVSEDMKRLWEAFNYDIKNDIPIKEISSYLDSTWQLNKNHLLACKDFIDKKILPNTGLRLFLVNKCRTAADLAQHRTMTAAWIAIIISLISVIIGNIFPLFQNDNVQ